MDGARLQDRLQRQATTLGDETRTLILGSRAIRIEGLDAPLARRLESRWGGFLSRSSAARSRATVRLLRAGADLWLDAPSQGEIYRIEALNEPPDRVVASYHFAIGADAAQGAWRVGITDQADEPIERIVENAVRHVAARVATEDGGFAMHSAGVARNGRAWLFAGPSRAGKSTAVRLSAPATSLGDDFGLVLPGDAGWVAPALPFDNSEQVEHEPPDGELSVAGIWRLYQSPEIRVEDPPHGLAVASLMGCVAFPWTLPEFADGLLERVERFVSEGRFHHLHFNATEPFWSHLG